MDERASPIRPQNSINVGFFTPEPQLSSSDVDDKDLIALRAEEARRFVGFAKPDVSVDELYFADGIYECCVFAATTKDVTGSRMDWWVVVGDLAPYVLEPIYSDHVEALQGYVDQMRTLIRQLRSADSSDHEICLYAPKTFRIVPVTERNLDGLEGRLNFVEETIIPWIRQGEPYFRLTGRSS